MGCPRKVKSKV